MKKNRGRPYATTVFRKEPRAGERPLSELRATLEYWSGAGSRNEPRWKGVLVPEPEDLYARLLAALDRGDPSMTLVSYRYDSAGLDPITLVDYLDDAGGQIGWDHVAFPEECRPASARLLAGFHNFAWWEYPLMLLDLPVYTALGLKELVGEAVKSPFSFVAQGWIGTAIEGRNPASPICFQRAFLAAREDWKNGFTALFYRLRARSRHTPLDLARDLMAAVPLVGPVFDHKSPPEDLAPPPATSFIVLSPGLNMSGDDEGYLAAWRRATEELRPGVVVTVMPFQSGGVLDVIFSLVNISHGPGYDLAARLVFDEKVSGGDAVELLGFSGGAQRAADASHALRAARITVNNLVGVAGPVAGNACAVKESLLLAGNALDDPVVFTTHAFRLLFPFFPSNIAVFHVPEGGGHQMPFLPDGATRAPHRGYADRLRAMLGEK